MAGQAIPLPKASSGTTVEQLAYIESFDAVVDKLYAMLLYKETKTAGGAWVMRIKASVTAGTVFDPSSTALLNGLRKAAAHGEKHLVWGFNLKPKEGDPRFVENRILIGGDGNPTAVEMHLVTRKPDGSAMEAVVASVPWPA